MALSLGLFASANITPPFSPHQLWYLSRNNLIPTHKWSTNAQLQNLNNSTSLRPNNYPLMDDDIYIQHTQKLKEAKNILKSKLKEEGLEVLYMIDAIQRFGIEYHFEEEIEEALQRKPLMMSSRDQDLYDVALQFRLLRQQGYYVHADVFDTFRDKKGNLKEKVCKDIMGLLQLHEASQLSVQGEKNLDEAGEISRELLLAWLSTNPNNNDHQKAKLIISNALQFPLHKSLPRFSERSSTCLNSYDFQFRIENKVWIDTFQELAKFDSYVVSSIHQQELLQVSKWWNHLGLAKELKFVRNEPLKWYMWPMACLTNPRFSEQRIELLKPLSLVYIIDDIFDIYGSIDELTLFTDAVNRWELENAENLPNHLKICFRALYHITNEFSYLVYIKHGWNPMKNLHKLWARLCDAFLVEAKWFASCHFPKADEYLKNAIMSSGVQVVLVHAFFLLNKGITQESIAIMDDFPAIISSVASILRLSDDLEGSMEHNEDGHDGSYLECYMKENQGISVEDTRKHVIQMISNSWKCLNQEFLAPFPLSFKNICLNTVRMVPLMYNCDGNYTR